MLRKAVILACGFCAVVGVAKADHDNGNGKSQDDHNGKCPVVTCEPCQPTACPDPAPSDVTTAAPAPTCPPVDVYVAPCQEYTAPMYKPCKRRKNGTLRCPSPKVPQRILVPVKE